MMNPVTVYVECFICLEFKKIIALIRSCFLLYIYYYLFSVAQLQVEMEEIWTHERNKPGAEMATSNRTNLASKKEIASLFLLPRYLLLGLELGFSDPRDWHWAFYLFNCWIS